MDVVNFKGLANHFKIQLNSDGTVTQYTKVKKRKKIHTHLKKGADN